MLDRAVAQVPDDIRTALTARGHALLIGVSSYDQNAWPPLSSVAGDIQDLARGLAPHFSTVDTLLDPTTNAIQTRLREFMTAQWNQPEERLLVYYAGHGFTSYNQNSHDYVGYITGKDTPACHGDDCSNAVGRAVSFNELDAVNRETRSRQVITLFDSCFSGSIFLVRANEGDPKHYDYIRARDAIRNPVRYYITAGAANEKIPANSPFAQLVLRGLQGEADTYNDGFITGEELGAYLQRTLPMYARISLHPQKETIRDARLGTGEFVFLTGLPKPNLAMAIDAFNQGQAAHNRQDYAEAMRWYRKAADQGYDLAQVHTGGLYENGLGVARDYTEAIRWYRKAADQEYDLAQVHIGDLYENGLGVAPDYTEAMRWYRKAADQGYDLAQVHIGNLYENGLGVARDYAEAMRWYRKAADQGYSLAQFDIGDLYKTGGFGVAQDYTEAMRWHRKSADQGFDLAQRKVAELYENGLGVSTSKPDAVNWYRRAARQGDGPAQTALRRLNETW
jgi:TPR repeat protein